jgi:hypothetical protein
MANIPPHSLAGTVQELPARGRGRRAAAEVARLIASRGGHPSGDFAKDIETVRSYYRFNHID